MTLTPALAAQMDGTPLSALPASPAPVRLPSAPLDQRDCRCGPAVHAACTDLRGGLDLVRAACRHTQQLLPALHGIDWQGEAADGYRARVRGIDLVAQESETDAVRLLARIEEAQ